MDPPQCIQNAMMTKDKKPFTYTPSGIDLSEIKSPRLSRRIERNAHAPGVTEVPHNPHGQNYGPPPPAALAAMQPQMPVQVFPSGPPPPPPMGRMTGKCPPPPPQPANGPPPPPPPMGALPTQKVVNVNNEVVDRPDMTKIIPENPMGLLRKTGGPKIKNFVDEMYSNGAPPAASPPTQQYTTPPQFKMPQQDQAPPQANYQAPPQANFQQSQPLPPPPPPRSPVPQQQRYQTTPPERPTTTPPVIERQVRPQQPPPQQFKPQVQQSGQQFSNSQPNTYAQQNTFVQPKQPSYQPPVIDRNITHEPQAKSSNLGSLYIPPANQTQQNKTVSPPTPPEKYSSPKVQSPGTPTLKEAPKPWQLKNQHEEVPEWAKRDVPSETQPRIHEQQQQQPISQPKPSQQAPQPRYQHPPQSQQQSTPVYVQNERVAHNQPHQHQPHQHQASNNGNGHPNAVYVTQPIVLVHPGPRPTVGQNQPQREVRQPAGNLRPRVDQDGSVIIPVQIEGKTSGGSHDRSFQRQQSNPSQSNSFKVIQKITNTDEDDESVPVTSHSPKFPANYQLSNQIGRLKMNEESRNLKQQGIQQPQVRTIPVQLEGESTPYVHPSQQTVPEPKIYMGSNIPSRSFRVLQATLGPDGCASQEYETIENSENYEVSRYNSNLPPPPSYYWPHLQNNHPPQEFFKSETYNGRTSAPIFQKNIIPNETFLNLPKSETNSGRNSAPIFEKNTIPNETFLRPKPEANTGRNRAPIDRRNSIGNCNFAQSIHNKYQSQSNLTNEHLYHRQDTDYSNFRKSFPAYKYPPPPYYYNNPPRNSGNAYDSEEDKHMPYMAPYWAYGYPPYVDPYYYYYQNPYQYNQYDYEDGYNTENEMSMYNRQSSREASTPKIVITPTIENKSFTEEVNQKLEAFKRTQSYHDITKIESEANKDCDNEELCIEEISETTDTSKESEDDTSYNDETLPHLLSTIYEDTETDSKPVRAPSVTSECTTIDDEDEEFYNIEFSYNLNKAVKTVNQSIQTSFVENDQFKRHSFTLSTSVTTNREYGEENWNMYKTNEEDEEENMKQIEYNNVFTEKNSKEENTLVGIKETSKNKQSEYSEEDIKENFKQIDSNNTFGEENAKEEQYLEETSQIKQRDVMKDFSAKLRELRRNSQLWQEDEGIIKNQEESNINILISKGEERESEQETANENENDEDFWGKIIDDKADDKIETNIKKASLTYNYENFNETKEENVKNNLIENVEETIENNEETEIDFWGQIGSNEDEVFNSRRNSAFIKDSSSCSSDSGNELFENIESTDKTVNSNVSYEYLENIKDESIKTHTEQNDCNDEAEAEKIEEPELMSTKERIKSFQKRTNNVNDENSINDDYFEKSAVLQDNDETDNLEKIEENNQETEIDFWGQIGNNEDEQISSRRNSTFIRDRSSYSRNSSLIENESLNNEYFEKTNDLQNNIAEEDNAFVSVPESSKFSKDNLFKETLTNDEHTTNDKNNETNEDIEEEERILSVKEKIAALERINNPDSTLNSPNISKTITKHSMRSFEEDSETASDRNNSIEIKYQEQEEEEQEIITSVKDKIAALERKNSTDSSLNTISISKTTTKSSISMRSFEELSEEEIDSGITSDISRHISDNEEFTELRRMNKYQRAATHSRLFNLLQTECDVEEEKEAKPVKEDKFAKLSIRRRQEDNNQSFSRINLNSLEEEKEVKPRDKFAKLSIRRKQEENKQSFNRDHLSLPLTNINMPDSGINSPASPPNEKLVNELVHSMLKRKKGRVFSNMAREKLYAAAKRILEEDMDGLETPDDYRNFMSPETTTHFETPQECYNSESEYNEYYNSWTDAEKEYYDNYDICPSKAFKLLKAQAGNGKISGFSAKCPKILSRKNIFKDTLLESSEEPQNLDNPTSEKSLKTNDVAS